MGVSLLKWAFPCFIFFHCRFPQNVTKTQSGWGCRIDWLVAFSNFKQNLKREKHTEVA
jgi:hypothetical protein